MKFEEMGNMSGKTMMLLPGTCCDWQINFESDRRVYGHADIPSFPSKTDLMKKTGKAGRE